jgi:hypothetical protein
LIRRPVDSAAGLAVLVARELGSRGGSSDTDPPVSRLSRQRC